MKHMHKPTRSDEDSATITIQGPVMPPLGHGVAKRTGAGTHGGSPKRKNRQERKKMRQELRQQDTDH